MRRTIPLAKAKAELSALVDEVDRTYERIVITRNGTDTAVLLSAEEYEGLLETLDLQRYPDEEKAIAKAEKQAKSGRTISLTTLKKRITQS
ncbi:MAG: type II toxin-antitoxin system Phd/YefM family antitoxin [Nitrospirota bacterium]|nr:type II toxin-antitoxin system Phd/YefM family antitoxin [Nitrospirota bacterium]